MKARDIIEALSHEQRAAALTTDRPVLTIAGAGSGKTRTLVARFAHLVLPPEQGGLGADADSIMMVTFTNKAAREMRERIAPVLEEVRQLSEGRFVGEPWIGTFHGLSLRILRMEAARAGLRRDFSIYDESDARALASDIAEARGLDRFDVDAFFQDLEFAKSRMLTPPLLARKATGLAMKEDLGDPFDHQDRMWRRVLDHFVTQDFPAVYAAYQRMLLEQNAVDFSDLLNAVTDLMRANPEIRASWQSTFRHFMIDEVQDMNLAQAAWLQAFTAGARQTLVPEPSPENHDAPADPDGLAARYPVNRFRLRAFPRPTVAFVGDDDQSIYAFRGSDVSIMRGLPGRYENLEVLYLKESWRCQPAILGVANRVIAHNEGRFGKDLVPGDPGREAQRVRCQILETSEQELQALRTAARRWIEDGRPAHEFAILLRTRELAKTVAKDLRAAGLPVVEGKAADLRKAAEVRDAMAFAGFLVNPDAEMLFRRIANKPARGLGQTSMARIARNARLKEISFMQEARSVAEGRAEGRIDLPPGAEPYGNDFQVSLRQFWVQMEGLRQTAGAAPSARAALAAVLEETGYLHQLRREAIRAAGLPDEPALARLAPRDLLSRIAAASGHPDEHPREEDDLEAMVDAASQAGESARRLGNIAMLLDQAEGFGSLGDFLQEMALESSEAESASGIRVMTLHAAKGLEFDRVHLPFWVEGVMPHWRSLSEADEPGACPIEEERRLAYVGLTRARQDLTISTFERNTLPSLRLSRVRRSRFLSEVMDAGPDLVEITRSGRRPGPAPGSGRDRQGQPRSAVHEARTAPITAPAPGRRKLAACLARGTGRARDTDHAADPRQRIHETGFMPF